MVREGVGPSDRCPESYDGKGELLHVGRSAHPLLKANIHNPCLLAGPPDGKAIEMYPERSKRQPSSCVALSVNWSLARGAKSMLEAGKDVTVGSSTFKLAPGSSVTAFVAIAVNVASSRGEMAERTETSFMHPQTSPNFHRLDKRESLFTYRLFIQDDML